MGRHAGGTRPAGRHCSVRRVAETDDADSVWRELKGELATGRHAQLLGLHFARCVQLRHLPLRRVDRITHLFPSGERTCGRKTAPFCQLSVGSSRACLGKLTVSVVFTELGKGVCVPLLRVLLSSIRQRNAVGGTVMPAAGLIVREISSAVTLIGVAVALQRKKKTVPVSATYNFPRVFCPECALVKRSLLPSETLAQKSKASTLPFHGREVRDEYLQAPKVDIAPCRMGCCEGADRR
jgi:hypothetical protein